LYLEEDLLAHGERMLGLILGGLLLEVILGALHLFTQPRCVCNPVHVIVSGSVAVPLEHDSQIRIPPTECVEEGTVD
jgi:hypothetical protein